MKDTDKITLTLGQLKRLVKESKISRPLKYRKMKESLADSNTDILTVVVDWATDEMEEEGRWMNYIKPYELDEIHDIEGIAQAAGTDVNSLWLSDHIDFADLTKSDLTIILNSFLKKHHFYGVTGKINLLNGPGGGYPEITLTGPRSYVIRLLKKYWDMDDRDIENATI